MRGQIIEVLLDTPHTIKQTAAKLGLAPSKLYYHFNLLEKHGLIRVVETRKVANLEEKHYQAAAARFEVAPGLLATHTAEGKANANEVLLGILDTTRQDMARSLQARYFQLEQGASEHPLRVLLTRLVSRLDEAQVADFQARLCALLKDFESADCPPETPEARPYAFTAALYPSFYFEETPHD